MIHAKEVSISVPSCLQVSSYSSKCRFPELVVYIRSTQNTADDSVVPIRIFLAEMETISRHSEATGPPLCCSSAGSEEAVADTSRRVSGALTRKSALKHRLDDAIKRLQAAERGKIYTASTVCSFVCE